MLRKVQNEQLKNQLRQVREVTCFPIINRGPAWYHTLSEDRQRELYEWYQDWLNVTETLETPTRPYWLK